MDPCSLTELSPTIIVLWRNKNNVSKTSKIHFRMCKQTNFHHQPSVLFVFCEFLSTFLEFFVLNPSEMFFIVIRSKDKNYSSLGKEILQSSSHKLSFRLQFSTENLSKGVADFLKYLLQRPLFLTMKMKKEMVSLISRKKNFQIYAKRLGLINVWNVLHPYFAYFAVWIGKKVKSLSLVVNNS